MGKHRWVDRLHGQALPVVCCSNCGETLDETTRYLACKPVGYKEPACGGH